MFVGRVATLRDRTRDCLGKLLRPLGLWSGCSSRRVLSPSRTLLCDIVFLLGDAPSERYHFLRPSFGVVPHGQWAHLDKLRLALIDRSANFVEPFLCPDSPPSLSSTDSTRGSGCDGSSLLALRTGLGISFCSVVLWTCVLTPFVSLSFLRPV